MIRLTRRYRFCASHRLHSERFSEPENQQMYGKCNNPFGHGHDYVLEVSVDGPVDAATGQAVHLGKLDQLVRDNVLRDFDHRDFNQDVPEFADVVPTSENIVRVVEQRLRRDWASHFGGEWPRLNRIRLQETKRNQFELTT